MDIYEETTLFYQSVKAKKRVLGKSLFGRNIYAIKLGDGAPVGIAQYAMHGREYITAKLAFAHYHFGLQKGSCWLIPLANPDGALLSQTGIKSAPKSERAFLREINKGDNFSLWKANGRGVDLNVNFDADWGKGEKNVFYPSSENCVGEHAFSELETQALQKFTEEIEPDYTVSFHTKGEEIYWGYDNSTHTCPRHFAIGKAISEETGYRLLIAKGSAGGYKDWCVLKYGIPAYTIEVGSDSLTHPLGNEALDNIIKKCKRIVYKISECI